MWCVVDSETNNVIYESFIEEEYSEDIYNSKGYSKCLDYALDHSNCEIVYIERY